jgi:TatA/E family protein of Tat protein translocase
MFGLGPAEVVLILIIALIVLGPGRLPEVGAALGKTIREFRQASTQITEEFTREFEETKRAVQVEPQPSTKADESATEEK